MLVEYLFSGKEERCFTVIFYELETGSKKNTHKCDQNDLTAVFDNYTSA